MLLCPHRGMLLMVLYIDKVCRRKFTEGLSSSSYCTKWTREGEAFPLTVTNEQDGGSSSTYLITDKVCEYVGHLC